MEDLFARHVGAMAGAFTIDLAPARLVVKVKQQLFEATETLLLHFRRKNMISHRDLSTIIGRLGNIAHVLVVWRPFLAPWHAALYSTEKTGAPSNCFWTRQIAPEPDWFAAFFKATGGFIQRTFLVEHYLEPSNAVDIVLDVSPWGLGDRPWSSSTHSNERFEDQRGTMQP